MLILELDLGQDVIESAVGEVGDWFLFLVILYRGLRPVPVSSVSQLCSSDGEMSFRFFVHISHTPSSRNLSSRWISGMP